LLTDCLDKHVLAVPSFPTNEKVGVYQEAIMAKYPLLVDMMA
jgi:hypothetical protein